MKTKSVKRVEAVERNEKWANMSPKHQLEYLDKNNLVATKQRKKIAARLENEAAA